MSDILGAALAERVHRLTDPGSLVVTTPVTSVPRDILEGIREALLAGETHYTARPGIPELRARVAERLDFAGRTGEEVVITSGEREALFVARLALGLDPLSLGKSASIVVLGAEPFGRDLGPLPPATTYVGSLDGLPGLATFRVGFVCAAKELTPKIRGWKQALSICAPAPSQRAALLALSR